MRPNQGRQVQRDMVRPSYTRRPESRKRELPKLKVAWVKVAAITTLVLLFLALISHMTALKKVTITGNHTLATDHLSRIVSDNLSQQWFGKNILLINTSALENALEQADPGVKQAVVHRKFLHGLSVTIIERQPTLNWKSGDTVYLLDAQANVLGITKGQYVNLPTVVDSSNLPVKVGDRVAPTAFVTFCSQLSGQLPAAGYQITQMTVPASTSEIYVTTNQKLLIKFDTTRPVGDELADLQAVQTELTKARKAPHEYIDLRIEHKAYYK